MKLETQRLALHEIAPGDREWIIRLLGDPAVMRYWPAPYTRDGACAWIDKQIGEYREFGVAYWLARLKAGGAPIGLAGLLMRDVFGTIEPSVGYIFATEAWGRGLASEAARACLRYGLDTCAASRVLCMIRPENVPSLRVAARLRLLPIAYTIFFDLPHLVFACDRSTPGFEAAPRAGST